MILLLFSFLLAGCQAAPSNKVQLVVHLQLPSTVAKGSLRYRHLIERTKFLRLSLSTSKRWRRKVDSPPRNWGTLVVGEVDFPADDKDWLTVTAGVWDAGKNGALRPYPVLAGKATVRASDLAGTGPTEVPLKLSLKVSPSEFD